MNSRNRAHDPLQSLIGTQLGKYEIREEIGRGGMGTVFKAYDPSLERFAAIKVLAPHLVWEQEFVERFLREARAAARLRHPGIVTIYDVGQAGGWYYFAMDYLEGDPLARLIEKHGPMALKKTLALLRPIAAALDYAHQQGLIHRDVKPGNIIISPKGQATLTDFGIARAAAETRLTRTGTIIGTPEYMAPEQASGGSVDSRTDQYALAVVAYEMLSGRVPFRAESTPALLHKVVYEPPPPLREARPDLPAAVEHGLEKALAKEQAQRYRSCSEFIESLEQVARVPQPRPSAPQPSVRPQAPAPAERDSSQKALWIGLGAAGLLLIGLCGAILGGAMALPGIFDEASASATATPWRPTTTVQNISQTATGPNPTTPPGTSPPTRSQETSPTPQSSTNTPSPGSTIDTALRWNEFGRSAQGRTLEAGIVGDAQGDLIVVVGSIQGDQPNTRDLLDNLVQDFNADQDRIPSGQAFIFIPTINPDGNAAGTRRNANDVDLNRNWDTFDWTANPDQPGGTVRGAGGARPHSEPETRDLAQYLSQLHGQDSTLQMVLFHASQRISSGGGHVYPGYTSAGLDPDALGLAKRYANTTGYEVKSDWTPYETTGELITWCAEESIAAIDIVIPRSTAGSDRNLRRTTMEALLELAR